jgi:hypothetical protein
VAVGVLVASGPGSEPTNAQLDAMPTSAEALRAALLAEAKQQMQLSFMKPPLPTDDGRDEPMPGS